MYKEGLVFLSIIILAYSCKTTSKVSVQDVTDKTFLFPIEWIGHYQGDLYILGTQKGDTLKVDMELIIDSPNGMGLYPWVLKYNDKDVRYYGLEVVDAEKGHYLIDEYNSIKIDGFLRSNHFITRFSVQNSDLIFHYEKKQDGIAISVYATEGTAYSTTGGEIIKQDTVPTVDSYRLAGYQTGFLKKLK